jgi:predicted transcriptional regulator
MPKRITLNLPEELAHRLAILADTYDCDVTDLAQELIEDGATICEAAIEREACEQIRYLANAEPLGRA